MTCPVENCGQPLYQNKRYCGGHFMRAWRYGDPLHVPTPRFHDKTGLRYGMLVGQSRTPDGMWRCQCDCGTVITTRPGSLNKGTTASCGRHRTKDVVTYEGAHDRVVAAKGRAKAYSCVDCGGQAHDWSYDHADVAELTQCVTTRGNSYEVAYSLNPDHYEPRCITCHRRFDRGRSDAARASTRA